MFTSKPIAAAVARTSSPSLGDTPPLEFANATTRILKRYGNVFGYALTETELQNLATSQVLVALVAKIQTGNISKLEKYLHEHAPDKPFGTTVSTKHVSDCLRGFAAWCDRSDEPSKKFEKGLAEVTAFVAALGHEHARRLQRLASWKAQAVAKSYERPEETYDMTEHDYVFLSGTAFVPKSWKQKALNLADEEYDRMHRDEKGFQILHGGKAKFRETKVWHFFSLWWLFRNPVAEAGVWIHDAKIQELYSEMVIVFGRELSTEEFVKILMSIEADAPEAVGFIVEKLI